MRTWPMALTALALCMACSSEGTDDSPATGGSGGSGGSSGSGGSGGSGGGSGSGGAGGSGGTGGAPPVTCTEEVTNVSELEAAVAALGPGKTVCLAPGDYVLGSRLVLGSGQSGTADAPAVIAARDGLGSVTIDAAGAEEAIWFDGASHAMVTGLRITGGGYHAIKVDVPSTDVWIVGNVLFENTNAADSGAQFSAIKGCCLQERTIIVENEIYETGSPSTNLQGIDCNGCKSWEVRGNRIHGIRVGDVNGVAIQFKSGSADTIIENNVIWDSGIGINYGGFGNPQQWGNETFEHLRGVVRNNVVYGCGDAGISVINNKDGKVFNNTLFDNGFTPDVRVAAENLQYRNNILDRALNFRDGTSGSESNNYVLSAPNDGSVFVDAAALDFHLAAGAAPIDQGMDLASDVPLDFEGEARPKGSAFDCGADEH